MNKYQKEKSREIRDIMRSDNWRRMTYKEAKRKWRKGIRAFRIGDMYAWKAANLSHLGFSRKQLKEIGKAYHKISLYSTNRNLIFDCYHEVHVDSYILRFTGWAYNGKKFGIGQVVSCDQIRQYSGSLLDITHRVLEEVECRRKQFVFPSEIKPMKLDLDRRMLFGDSKIMSREEVLAVISVKEVT